MLDWSAEKPIDVKSLDQNVLRKYSFMLDALEILDDWILSPNNELLAKLKSISKQLNMVQKLPRNVKLFRGVDPKSSYQDTMGLSEKGFLWNAVRQYSLGDHFIYSIDRPLSFTTDMDIALAFGTTVVLQQGPPRDYIWLSDELSYLISKRRNIEPVTQKEIIILPPDKLSLEIIAK